VRLTAFGVARGTCGAAAAFGVARARKKARELVLC